MYAALRIDNHSVVTMFIHSLCPIKERGEVLSETVLKAQSQDFGALPTMPDVHK